MPKQSSELAARSPSSPIPEKMCSRKPTIAGGFGVSAARLVNSNSRRAHGSLKASSKYPSWLQSMACRIGPRVNGSAQFWLSDLPLPRIGTPGSSMM